MKAENKNDIKELINFTLGRFIFLVVILALIGLLVVLGSIFIIQVLH